MGMIERKSLWLLCLLSVGCSNLSATMPSPQQSPVAQPFETTPANTAQFSILFEKPAFQTQADLGAHHTEIRLMYTEGVVRFADAGKDYHVGLTVANPTTGGYKFVTASGLSPTAPPIRMHYRYAQNTDDPIFPAMDAATCSETISPLDVDQSYFLGKGFYETAGTGELPPDNVFLHHAATFDTPAALELPSIPFDAASQAFARVFQNIIVVKADGQAVAISPTTANPPIDQNACFIKPYLRVLSGGAGEADSAYGVLYKLVLPGGARRVDFGSIPLGKLIVDVRRFGTGNIMESYGYGQYQLNNGVSILGVGSILGFYLTTNPIQIQF